MAEKRKAMDCSKQPGSTCTVYLEGSEDEVMKLGKYHMVHDHHHKDTPELNNELRGALQNA